MAIPFYHTDTSNERIVRIREVKREGRPSRTGRNAARFADAAAIEPVHAEKFYRAYERIKAKGFYLSVDQIDEVNAHWDNHWERRTSCRVC